MYRVDDPPAFEFAYRSAHLRTRHIERLGDLFGVHPFRRQEEKGVDLGHGAADAPARAHFSPVQDELALDVSKFRHFCTNRHIRNKEQSQAESSMSLAENALRRGPFRWTQPSGQCNQPYIRFRAIV